MAGTAGRCRHRPLRNRIMGCVGEGLCPARGRPQGSPLRRGYKRRGEVRNPPVTASPCQPPLGKGALKARDADCHDQFANWSRNDTFYKRCGTASAGGQRRPPLRMTRKFVQARADRGVRPYADVYVFLSAHRKTPGMAPAFQVWVLCACGAARHHLYYM